MDSEAGSWVRLNIMPVKSPDSGGRLPRLVPTSRSHGSVIKYHGFQTCFSFFKQNDPFSDYLPLNNISTCHFPSFLFAGQNFHFDWSIIVLLICFRWREGLDFVSTYITFTSNSARYHIQRFVKLAFISLYLQMYEQMNMNKCMNMPLER